MKKSRALRQRAATVQQFHDALAEMLKYMEPAPKPGMVFLTELRAREGYEDRVAEMDGNVSHLAGKAAAAAGRYEVTMHIELPHGRGTQALRTVQSWRYALDTPFLLPPDYMLSNVRQIIGRLEGEADIREQQERTLAGRVAIFVGFPNEVRAVMGQTSRAAGQAGFIVTTAAQVVGALILLGLGTWLGVSLI
ncbi:hypothetical protein [Catellatospora paridis]|uniref:hypothetical protein n=1 Tax=Catellatospora paridis TaxID=1617086 RepID=UPI0012D38E6F|nr:hypothetical protein [Catellatospora paridis]